MGVVRLCAAGLLLGGLAFSSPAQEDVPADAVSAPALFHNALALRLRPLAGIADEAKLKALADGLVALAKRPPTIEFGAARDGRARREAYEATARYWDEDAEAAGQAIQAVLGEGGLRRWQTIQRERRNALTAAHGMLFATHLAMEMRLRQPQLDRLRGAVTRWLVERERDDKVAGTVPDISGFLASEPGVSVTTPRQREILVRMRQPTRPPLLKREDPGDDLLRGRGRYPEDEFELEFEALCAFRGASPADHGLLHSAAIRCGRRERRSAGRPSRIGSTAVFRSVCDPRESELWRALVQKELGSEVDPGPAAVEEGALAAARARVLLEMLTTRVGLSLAQREACVVPLETFAARQLSLRPQNGPLVEPKAIWKALRMDGSGDPRRSSSSRRTLIKSLEEILDAPQRLELGL